MSGLSLLPEWAAQDAVMLTWPHPATDWVDFLAEVEATFYAIATQISRYANLVVVCHDVQVKAKVSAEFSALGIYNAHFAVIANNDSWARDHGPITVQNNENQLFWLDFEFTGWGDKFESALDNAITAQLAKAEFIQINARLPQPLILEGGAIETDGQGHLLVTRHCLLNDNRNEALSQTALEETLGQLFGIRKFLWLDHGYLAGDDTDAHIDTLARFTPHQGIVYVSCDDPHDEHFQPLQAMAAQLKDLVTLDHQPFQLFALPWPQAKYAPNGERLPASYANYLIINGAILMPTYGDSQDEPALAVLAQAYPGYAIHGIDCQALIRQYGSLHCVTMQLPKGCLRTPLPTASNTQCPIESSSC